MSRYEDEVRAVASLTQAMDSKLRENSEKQSWLGEPMRWLYDRMQEEATELAEALDSYEKGGPVQAVINEAADVANFCAFIVDSLCIDHKIVIKSREMQVLNQIRRLESEVEYLNDLLAREKSRHQKQLRVLEKRIEFARQALDNG